MPVPTITVDTHTRITVSFTTVTSPVNGGETVTNYQVEYNIVADSTRTTTAPITTLKDISGLTTDVNVLMINKIYRFSGYSNIHQ